MTLRASATKLGVSKSTLGRIELDQRATNPELRAQIMRLYGYDAGSIKNFRNPAKSGELIHPNLRIERLLRQLNEKEVGRVLEFLDSIVETRSFEQK